MGLYLVGLVMAGCLGRNTEEQAPSGLIPRDTFVVILTEVRLLEGAYSTSYERVDTSEYTINAYYNRIFSDHGVTDKQYLDTYDYYSRNMEELLEIEGDVALRLEQLKWAEDSVAVRSR